MYYFTISEFGKLRNVNINSLRYYEKYPEVIVANILQDNFQIGTKKSELQKRIPSNI